MKRLITILLLCCSCTLIFSQNEIKNDSLKRWNTSGKLSLLINQSAFNNEWTGGGESSFSGNLNFNYDFNYAKNDIVWDNKLISAYGITQIKGNDSPTKTDDRFDFHSMFGKKAKKEFWYYSAFLGLKSQFDSGFMDAVKTSHFVSPLYMQMGVGMLWKKSDNLKLNISPLTNKLVLVHDHFTQFGSAFGVEQGETTRYEFGANLSGYYKFNLFENVSVENILMMYSNYLEDPQNVDIDYTLNLVMTINKFMSTNIVFQAIYDDNTIKGFQIREVFGLGFNVAF